MKYKISDLWVIVWDNANELQMIEDYCYTSEKEATKAIQTVIEREFTHADAVSGEDISVMSLQDYIASDEF